MARIKHNSKEIGLLARLMRSEAVGDGNVKFVPIFIRIYDFKFVFKTLFRPIKGLRRGCSA